MRTSARNLEPAESTAAMLTLLLEYEICDNTPPATICGGPSLVHFRNFRPHFEPTHVGRVALACSKASHKSKFYLDLGPCPHL